jgi:C4-dicarboxylate-specific signal transduction histidine kinase
MPMDPHLRILHTVAQAVSRSLDVDEVLKTALDELTRVTGHEISSLHLLTADGRQLELMGERGLPQRLREVNLLLPVGKGQLGGVAATGNTLVLESAVDDPDLLPEARQAMEEYQVRGLVCVPIRSRGRILGTLTLGRHTEDPFTAREVTLVEATADQIGIALDNARLYSETRRQLDELKRTQAQLIHAEKLSAVGQLASGVAHEINNPLTTILGQTHLLLSQQPLDPHMRERLGTIYEESARAARIVQNLLLFSRHYPPERQPCLLEDQVRRVLDLMAYQLQQANVVVRTEFKASSPVWADAHQIQQVLLNLVQNAHQAMGTHAATRELVMRVTADDAHARIDVLDTGPGILPDVLPRIFDPFFTTKPAGEGSGLGLSVSYGIVAEHRGRLWAENRPEGGAAFHIELPLGT